MKSYIIKINVLCKFDQVITNIWWILKNLIRGFDLTTYHKHSAPLSAQHTLAKRINILSSCSNKGLSTCNMANDKYIGVQTRNHHHSWYDIDLVKCYNASYLLLEARGYAYGIWQYYITIGYFGGQVTGKYWIVHTNITNSRGYQYQCTLHTKHKIHEAWRAVA